MLRKITAIYSIIMGASMISMWTMLLFTEGIPELTTEPARIIMHMIAEYSTAIFLIIGGYGLLKAKKWGYNIYLLATGALVYTLIQSPGYYLHQGVIGFVVMFGAFLVMSLVLVIAMMRKKEGDYQKSE